MEVEKKLLDQPKVPFSFNRIWCHEFPDNAGVYAIFDEGKLVYVGESANIRERMKEIKRTVNHSFRRSLGKHLHTGATIVKGKFAVEIESMLNQYYIDNISISAIEVNFGRLEIESNLIEKYRNQGILNSEPKRKAKQYI